MATEDDKINTGALATVVAVGALGMIGVSLAVNALVRHEVGSIGAERDATGEVAYHSMRDSQLQKLSAPADWSDRAKGQVSIPIDRAMGLVLADLKRSPWSASPWPSPDAGAQGVDPTLPDAGADAGASDAGGPEGDAAATATDAGPAPEPPAGSALSPSAPAPPTSAKPAPPPRPSAAPPKPTGQSAPTAAAPAPTAPPAAPASPTPPATP